MTSIPAPTWFHPGDVDDIYEVAAMNDGPVSTSGPLTITDKLPKGLTVAAITADVEPGATDVAPAQFVPCEETTAAKIVTVTCTSGIPVHSDRMVAVKISVDVPTKATGTLSNFASISGGGAETASAENLTPVTPVAQKAPFGVSVASDLVADDGSPDIQAGSHPYAYTTILAYNSAGISLDEECGAAFVVSGRQNPANTQGCPNQAGAPRNVEVALPPGFVGDPMATPRCIARKFQTAGYRGCPAASQVGVAELEFFDSELTQNQLVPIYNVEPTPGQPAELGFSISTIGHVAMFFHLHPLADGGYALTSTVSQITQFVSLHALVFTLWGVPAEESHTPIRLSEAEGQECASGTDEDCADRAAPRPFLTLPTSCTGVPLGAGVGVDSWQNPLAAPLPVTAEAGLGTITGCETLALGEPSIAVAPSTDQAGSPAGYGVRIAVPQNEEPEALGTPDVRDVQVTMPEGTVISPSAANGLQDCSSALFGQGEETVGHCPAQSRIGTVQITSPLLDQPITGNVYVGEPECSPCTAQQAEEGKMVHVLIEAKLTSPQREAEMTQTERENYRPAVLIKLSGDTMINRQTGRLTTVFDENPQLPFNELNLEIEDGQDAPLVNPTSCGPIAATAHLTAWSALVNAEGTVSDPASEANISSSAVSIGGCATPGFSPAFSAGMTSSQRAGAFSSFAVNLQRPDGQQTLGSVTMHMPPGLVGMLSNVQLCGEPQANEGTCSAASQIGTTTAVVGPGTEPYTIGGGKVYLTGPYGGGSFGLSIVVPAEAGPFHLAGLNGAGGEGDGSVVVRGSIKIDPTTSALTIVTNPIPTQLNGIPLDLRHVTVEVNREGFMFNPTNCEAMTIAGTIDSSSGAVADVSYPFQAVDCAALPFNPSFAVATHAKHTRRDGAYLHVDVTSGGGQANIKSVFVELPKVLAAREEALKGACSEKQFAGNPAGCPAGSFVGTATAVTPVLNKPLSGPAIFVSHGGAAFPDLDVMLQGEGVTVDLAGSTNIVKGITSSDFKAVPDVPVTRFELTLPEQKNAALAATANLCYQTTTKRVKVKVHGKTVYRKHRTEQRRTLVMPTKITGQNGAVINQSTKIAVEGCGTKAR
ncbi:MAG TPA: hypothetical protein VGP17_05345 [Solirubrobacteraceae bacterium]|jgi:hypothetical protein|nr:hypothetical protein [Solirubrobacteraceae bacterium]